MALTSSSFALVIISHKRNLLRYSGSVSVRCAIGSRAGELQKGLHGSCYTSPRNTLKLSGMSCKLRHPSVNGPRKFRAGPRVGFIKRGCFRVVDLLLDDSPELITVDE
jgi:hypothetical protein